MIQIYQWDADIIADQNILTKRLYYPLDPCTEDFGVLNDTVQDIHKLPALRIATIINQCRLDYNRTKDNFKYWYRATINPNCNRIASNLSSIKGK